ncbi:MAG TPA: serine hydrolase domain-containing protein [Sphingomonas sp.]|nr:serine hydrolase domain-containing protein [Sphingomonas sp.]
MKFAPLALVLALSAVPAAAESVDEVALRYRLAGEVLIGKGDKIVLDKAYGTIDPAGGKPHRPGERWRLASITKQVTAALVVGAAGPALDRLDRPVAINAADRGGFGDLTVRQLLTHHSGLPNPDRTSAGPDGVPSFYKGSQPDLAICLGGPAQPGAAFSYNNCDYIPFGLSKPGLTWPAGMAMAKPGERGVPGFVAGKPEPTFNLSSFGAAGGLLGTARSVFGFDRSLMTGKLLKPAALAELWKPEGNGSYQALGQWVFPGQLKGCAKAKRIVQRDGEIWGVQARNFIFPDDDLVVIVFTNRSADDFAFGEVWEGKGFTYDLLSAAACPSA